jgi:hypothetical protein
MPAPQQGQFRDELSRGVAYEATPALSLGRVALLELHGDVQAEPCQSAWSSAWEREKRPGGTGNCTNHRNGLVSQTLRWPVQRRLARVALRSAGTNQVLAWLREMDALRQAGIAA